MITDEYVKEGVVVVDVGINRLEDNSLCGDVDYEKSGSLSILYYAGTWWRRTHDHCHVNDKCC